MTTPNPEWNTAVDAFADKLAPALTPLGNYDHGPAKGHGWHWSTGAGIWSVHVGGVIDAGPVITGPGMHWLLTEYTLRNADLVLLMLQLAGAITAPPATGGIVREGAGYRFEPYRAHLLVSAAELTPQARAEARKRFGLDPEDTQGEADAHLQHALGQKPAVMLCAGDETNPQD